MLRRSGMLPYGDAQRRFSPIGSRTADLAKARDPSALRAEQMFALDLLARLGDVEGTLDLLATGTDPVRERAADGPRSSA